MFGNRGRSTESAPINSSTPAEYSQAMAFIGGSLQPAETTDPITLPLPPVEVGPISAGTKTDEIAKLANEHGISVGDLLMLSKRILANMAKDLSPEQIKSRFAAMGEIASGNIKIEDDGTISILNELISTREELEKTRKSERFARGVATNLARYIPEDRVSELEPPAHTLYYRVQAEQQETE